MGQQLGRTIHPERRLGVSQETGPLPPDPSPSSSQGRSREAEKPSCVTCPRLVRQVQQAHPHTKAGTDGAMDEHRFGLKPIIRRVWVRKGHRPLVRVHQR